MSLRLAVLRPVLRRIARPMLRHTKGPVEGRRDLERVARHTFLMPPGCSVADASFGGVPGKWLQGSRIRSRAALIYLHGGGYFSGSSDTHKALAARLALQSGLGCVLPDYRLAPEHPFPTAYADAQRVHAALMARGYPAQRIVLAGDSAGGGLALALLADLCRCGLAPAGCAVFSPWTDLSASGGSIRSNAGSDLLLPVERLPELVEYYLNGADPQDPRASPLFAHFPSPPPVQIQVSRSEVLFDDARRMAALLQAAGGQVTLETQDDAPHVWPILAPWLPEANASIRAAARFLKEALNEAS